MLLSEKRAPLFGSMIYPAHRFRRAEDLWAHRRDQLSPIMRQPTKANRFASVPARSHQR